MEFSEELKNIIKQNMLHITTKLKKRPRNYLNKQLQDAVCNYFLENYVASFLKDDYQIASGRELRQKIERGLPSEGKKYINLLNKFKSEILRVNKGDEYRFMLSSIVDEEDNFIFESMEWCTLYRKKILALLLLVHFDQENILNFYEMWNSLFPNDPLIKKKLSKEEKEKQKYLEKGRTLSNLVCQNSPKTNINNQNTLIEKVDINVLNNQKNLQVPTKIFRHFPIEISSYLVKEEEENFFNFSQYHANQILNLREGYQKWEDYQNQDQEIENYLCPISIMTQLTHDNNYQIKQEWTQDQKFEDQSQYLGSHIKDQSYLKKTELFLFQDTFDQSKCCIKQEEKNLSQEISQQESTIQCFSTENLNNIFLYNSSRQKKQEFYYGGFESEGNYF